MPNGLIVQVSYDNVHNPVGSTLEAMENFEASIIVKDNR